MPEGISENLPSKKPGALKRITRAVKESLPWDPIGKKKRPIKPVPDGNLQNMQQQMEEDNKSNTLPDLESNIKASKQFIELLRNPDLYSQSPHDPLFLKSSLGYMVEKPVETGWFRVSNVVITALERYKLPLAIYVGPDHHARLLVKGVYDTPEGRKIKVYNPFHSGFEDVKVNTDSVGYYVGVFANTLAEPKLYRGEYDVMKFLEAPEFVKYRDLLTSIKAFGFQKDLKNCIPYCLFVDAMLYGLEPGATEFKRQGIKQFEQDFGVRILTKEEMLPQKPRVRIVE